MSVFGGFRPLVVALVVVVQLVAGSSPDALFSSVGASATTSAVTTTTAVASSTTPPGVSRVGAFHRYDDRFHHRRSHTRASGGFLATKAGRGGAGPVRLGQAGEDAVRGAYDIGPKIKVDVAGTKRIPDGLTPSTLSEVKNVGALSYTRQLRDYVQFAQQTGRRVDLYVRGGSSPTNISGPLRNALSDPSVPIRLRRIP